jgi:hypothetical protein
LDFIFLSHDCNSSQGETLCTIEKLQTPGNPRATFQAIFSFALKKEAITMYRNVCNVPLMNETERIHQ